MSLYEIYVMENELSTFIHESGIRGCAEEKFGGTETDPYVPVGCGDETLVNSRLRLDKSRNPLNPEKLSFFQVHTCQCKDKDYCNSNDNKAMEVVQARFKKEEELFKGGAVAVVKVASGVVFLGGVVAIWI